MGGGPEDRPAAPGRDPGHAAWIGPGVPASTYGCSDNDVNVTFDDASAVNLENHCAGTTPWYQGVGVAGRLARFP